MLQVQSEDGLTYYENQTVNSAMDLVERWRKQEGGKDGR
jgi:hypothetical protein